MSYADGPRPSLVVPAKSPEYRTYCQMLNRCSNSRNPSWKHYGGRGIVVCEAWKAHFNNFYADMGARPHGKSLDRIDVNGGYRPDNCRWATPLEQARNRRPPRIKADSYIGARIPPALKIALQQLAAANGRPLADEVREAFEVHTKGRRAKR